jgi:hypothetical protein
VHVITTSNTACSISGPTRVSDFSGKWTPPQPCHSRALRQFRGSLVHERAALLAAFKIGLEQVADASARGGDRDNYRDNPS